MGRKYICIERDRKYCEFGELRLKSIIPQIGDIEKATFDIRPPRATFEEMIKHGYFIVGEKMYFNAKPYFFLTNKGKFSNDNCEIDMHSAIAKIKGVKAKRLNGWKYWMVKRENSFVSIDLIRKQYLKEIKKFNQC